ncbi:MAG: class I SAM-dependent methyltransferase [Deltaproteobacteria bacterium]|nr:class I SAM-dependent methyltransferase [Deltaproteobacteria bacterium]MBW2447526.1 class I SAM-dependent methyltransferase [Deltaproteobacteria bacterium]
MTTDDSNAQQAAHWNDQAGPRWVRLQRQLDAQLAPLGEFALDAVGLAAGDRVLDVGCGCGASSRAAAARVAPGGRTVGIDLSGPMLERARELAEAEGSEQLEFVQADAQTHAFERLEPRGFDAILSRFGVMFFASPEAAFENLRSALVPGGRLAFVCWQRLADNTWMSAPLAAVARHLDDLPPPPAPGAPGPFAFADPGRVRGILAAAGFEQARVEALEGAMLLGGAQTAREAADFVVEMGPAGTVLRESGADAALRERVAVDAAKALEPFVREGGVAVPYAAWLVSARSPA